MAGTREDGGARISLAGQYRLASVPTTTERLDSLAAALFFHGGWS